jgi:hypothetical protein
MAKRKGTHRKVHVWEWRPYAAGREHEYSQFYTASSNPEITHTVPINAVTVTECNLAYSVQIDAVRTAYKAISMGLIFLRLLTVSTTTAGRRKICSSILDTSFIYAPNNKPEIYAASSPSSV